MYKNLYTVLFIFFLSWTGYNLYEEYLYPFYYNKFIYPKWEANRKAEIATRHLKIDNEFKSAKLSISSNELSLIKSVCGRYLKPEWLYFDECVAEKKEKLYYEKIRDLNLQREAQENALKYKETIEKQKEQENLYRMLEAYNAKKNQEPSLWEVILGYKALQSASNSLGGNSNNVSPCFFKSDSKSGMNKICYYNCTGSIKAKNVAITDICPLTY